MVMFVYCMWKVYIVCIIFILITFLYFAGLILPKVVRLYVSLWENDLDLWLTKQFPDAFMASVSSFKSSSMQHDVHFVNERPIQSKIDDKAAPPSHILWPKKKKKKKKRQDGDSRGAKLQAPRSQTLW